MSISKSFKIGEYAVGGIVKVTLNEHDIFIQALEWNTKEEVLQQTFNSFDFTKILFWLEEHVTSAFHADRIVKWMKEKHE